MRALRAAMREWSDASSASGSDVEELDDEEDATAAHELQLDTPAPDLEPADLALAAADVPLPASPSSPPTFVDIDEAAPSTPSAPPRPSSPPALVPLPRPLSSLSRLSRRTTLCLSRLVDLDDLDLDVETSRPAHEEGGEPSERDKELVERVIAPEVERVTEEVEVMVDEALRREDEEQGVVLGDEQVEDGEVVRAGGGEGEVRELEAVTWFMTEAGQVHPISHASSAREPLLTSCLLARRRSSELNSRRAQSRRTPSCLPPRAWYRSAVRPPPPRLPLVLLLT